LNSTPDKSNAKLENVETVETLLDSMQSVQEHVSGHIFHRVMKPYLSGTISSGSPKTVRSYTKTH